VVSFRCAAVKKVGEYICCVLAHVNDQVRGNTSLEWPTDEVEPRSGRDDATIMDRHSIGRKYWDVDPATVRWPEPSAPNDVSGTDQPSVLEQWEALPGAAGPWGNLDVGVSKVTQAYAH
jgi:hypothetical protein